MGDILETDDLVGDQDLVVSKSKSPSKAEPEKHSASHLLENMEGKQQEVVFMPNFGRFDTPNACPAVAVNNDAYRNVRIAS